jgi:hypothetical protein
VTRSIAAGFVTPERKKPLSPSATFFHELGTWSGADFGQSITPEI